MNTATTVEGSTPKLPEPIADVLRVWIGRALEHEEHVGSSESNEAAELLAVLCYGSQAETPHVDNILREILHPLARAKMLSVLDAKRAGFQVTAFVEDEFRRRGKLDCIRWFQRGQQQHWALQRLAKLALNQAPQTRHAAAAARDLLAALGGCGSISPLALLPDHERSDALRLIELACWSECERRNKSGEEGVTTAHIRAACKLVGLNMAPDSADLGAAASLVDDDRG